MPDEEYIQEGINMQLKPINDKLAELEKKFIDPRFDVHKEVQELEQKFEQTKTNLASMIETKEQGVLKRLSELERLIIHPNDGGTQLTLLEYQTTVYRNITELKDYYNIKKNVANETDFEWKVGIINRIIKSEEVLRDHFQEHLNLGAMQKDGCTGEDLLEYWDDSLREGLKKFDGEKETKIQKIEHPEEPTDTTANITQIIEIYDNGHEHVFYPDTHVLMEKADLEGYKKGLKEIRKKVKYMIKDGAREWFQETLAGLIQDVEKYLGDTEK